MKQIKKFIRSLWGKCFLIGFLILIAFGLRNMLTQKQEEKQQQENQEASVRDVVYAEGVEADNPILRRFEEEFSDAQVILACEEDVTNDACKDLIVIFKQEELTRTVVVIDSGDGQTYQFSTPIPAPVENQKIQFKNIDKEGEIEFVITGEKKRAVGYAISRMIDG